ncbi:beta-Ala-His dipeptidase-like isoform X3 [Ambystoma mexicanum]|uniref:beta-Ala-His dipeptidase-like isoform X3 n=1 Tax=Ambystoma mexicanum TaxID=8296 RepID=UPI0037E76236
MHASFAMKGKILVILLVMLPIGSRTDETAQFLLSDPLKDIFNHIDLHQDEFVAQLKTWLAVRSDSSDPALRGEVIRMMQMAAEWMKTLLGAEVQLVELGTEKLSNGESLLLPPVILAVLGSDPEKPTVCFYGHLDVQPAQKEDGWATDPYTMTEINGNLYARGATDNKGPVLAWLHAVKTYKALQKDIPVNLKFVIEGLEETGSDGLENLLKSKEAFFTNVDYIVISDNVWLSRKPALTYGTRGNAYFFVEVEGAKKDLHSGTFGGITHEAMTDLVALLAKLVDPSGRILIPGIYDDVAPLTEEEKKLYENIEFDLEEHKNATGVTKFRQATKAPMRKMECRTGVKFIHCTARDQSHRHPPAQETAQSNRQCATPGSNPAGNTCSHSPAAATHPSPITSLPPLQRPRASMIPASMTRTLETVTARSLRSRFCHLGACFGVYSLLDISSEPYAPVL